MMPTLNPANYMQQRLLLDMLARGAQVPQLQAGQARLPVEMPSGGQAPPYWPGAMPMPQQAPITAGINPSVPIPGIQVPQGAVSGATSAPVLQQSRLQKIMSVLQSPQMTAFLQAAGMGIGGPREAGESQMQQITRGIAMGSMGVRGEQERQRQLAMQNWQMQQAEREQARKERETTGNISAQESEAASRARQVGINEEQVRGQIELGKGSQKLEERKLNAQEWFQRESVSLEKVKTDAQLAEATQRIGLEKKRVELEQKQLDEAIATRGYAAENAKRQDEITKAHLAVLALERQLALKKQSDETKDPQQKAAIDIARATISASTGAMFANPGNWVEIMKNPKAASGIFDTIMSNAANMGKQISENVYKGTPVTGATKPWTPPAGATKVQNKRTGKSGYRLADGTVVDENGQPAQ